MSKGNEAPVYRQDSDGYVDWVQISWREFGKSMDTTIPYLLGRSDGYPALGTGLRIRGNKRMFPHEARMHIDDVPVFSGRVATFQMLRDGFVRIDDSRLRPLNDKEIDSALAELSGFGIPQDQIEQSALASRQHSLNFQVLQLNWLLTPAAS